MNKSWGIFKFLWEIICNSLREFFPPADPTPAKPEPPPAPIETPNLVLARQAEVFLGRDASPNDKASDELGCADSCSNVIRTVYKDFPHTISTLTLFQNLKNSPHFKSTLTPAKGCVIISPRAGAQPGHCGIFLSDTRIASNNSKTGLWQDNYSVVSWVKYFKRTKGLHVYIFSPL